MGVSDPWTGEELTRDYWLHLPASYPETDHATPLPLVLRCRQMCRYSRYRCVHRYIGKCVDV